MGLCCVVDRAETLRSNNIPITLAVHCKFIFNAKACKKVYNFALKQCIYKFKSFVNSANEAWLVEVLKMKFVLD